MSTAASPVIEVAVGLLQDDDGKVLLTRRADDVHLGGLWEFPGGKLDAGETARQALQREIREELGIDIVQATPLMRCRHRYTDLPVLLHVFRIHSYEGEAKGQEGQALAWVALADLAQKDLPEADIPIVTALQLPGIYAITPGDYGDANALYRMVQTALEQGLALLQFRNAGLDDDEYRSQATQLATLCKEYSALLLLNHDPQMVLDCGAHGLQIPARELREYTKRPLPGSYLVAASCHNAAELQLAENIEADFALLSPVQKTKSHPEAEALGWPAFAKLNEECDLPLYALGGMGVSDLAVARRHGALGVAMIGGAWRHFSANT